LSTAKLKILKGINPAQPKEFAPDVGNLIIGVRGQKVILDADLARIYWTSTKLLNRAVKRNSRRFPSDFVFQVSAEEATTLRFQFGTSKGTRGGRWGP